MDDYVLRATDKQRTTQKRVFVAGQDVQSAIIAYRPQKQYSGAVASKIKLLRAEDRSATSTRRLHICTVTKTTNDCTVAPQNTSRDPPLVYFRREVFRGLGQVLNRLPPRRGGCVPVPLGLDIQCPLLQTLLQPVVLDQTFHQTVQAWWCAVVSQLVLQLRSPIKNKVVVGNIL